MQPILDLPINPSSEFDCRAGLARESEKRLTVKLPRIGELQLNGRTSASLEIQTLIAKCACTDLTIRTVNVPPMSDRPSSVHAGEDEWFHVLDGEITFLIGSERVTAGAGTSVFAWRGVPHSFQNLTARSATVLDAVTSDDMENLLFIARS